MPRKYRNYNGTMTFVPLKNWRQAASYTRGKRSEAQVAAEVYHQFRKLNVPIRMELTTSVGRLDAVILDQSMSRAVAVIEIKRDESEVGNSDQTERYGAFGLPLYWIASTKEAMAMAPLIALRHGKDHGMALSDMATFSVPPMDELLENLNIKTGDNLGYRKTVY